MTAGSEQTPAAVWCECGRHTLSNDRHFVDGPPRVMTIPPPPGVPGSPTYAVAWVRHWAGACTEQTRQATAEEILSVAPVGALPRLDVIAIADRERARMLIDYEQRGGRLPYTDYITLRDAIGAGR